MRVFRTNPLQKDWQDITDVLEVDVTLSEKKLTVVTSSTKVDDSYNTVLIEPAVNTILSLPTIADVTNGDKSSIFNIKRSADVGISYTVSVIPDSSETIDGSASVVMSIGDSITLQGKSTDWKKL